MDIRNQSSVAALSSGISSSPPDSWGGASKHTPVRGAPRTTGELSARERVALLGWDEV
jgi:hypothetical protein